jgi:hypothetical protein
MVPRELSGKDLPMLYSRHVLLCCLIFSCLAGHLLITPAHAFTANSLDIVVDKNGDAVATFRFTLEGILENAIPQSVLEEELKSGLTTSSEPPELLSMDRSSATLMMKKFADTYDVATGTEYMTATMDFKKAEIALESSAISSVITADFSPSKIVLIFPDGYSREFNNLDVLPAVSHTVIDPAKKAALGSVPGPSPNGAINVTSSPASVKVYIDSGYLGDSPAVFPDIPAGTHVVTFQQEGFEQVSKNITVVAGKTTTVAVFLKYIPPTTTPQQSPGFFGTAAISALAACGIIFRFRH